MNIPSLDDFSLYEHCPRGDWFAFLADDGSCESITVNGTPIVSAGHVVGYAIESVEMFESCGESAGLWYAAALTDEQRKEISRTVAALIDDNVELSARLVALDQPCEMTKAKEARERRDFSIF